MKNAIARKMISSKVRLYAAIAKHRRSNGELEGALESYKSAAETILQSGQALDDELVTDLLSNLACLCDLTVGAPSVYRLGDPEIQIWALDRVAENASHFYLVTKDVLLEFCGCFELVLRSRKELDASRHLLFAQTHTLLQRIIRTR